MLSRNYANLENVGAIKIFIVYSMISSCKKSIDILSFALKYCAL